MRIRRVVGRVLRVLLWVIEGDAEPGGRIQQQALSPFEGGGGFPQQALSPFEGGGGFPPGGVVDEDWTGVKCLDVIAFNAATEPRAIAFVCELLRERRGLRVGAVCAEVALRYDVSTETAKRWILKHSASSGRLRIERGVLYLKDKS